MGASIRCRSALFVAAVAIGAVVALAGCGGGGSTGSGGGLGGANAANSGGNAAGGAGASIVGTWRAQYVAGSLGTLSVEWTFEGNGSFTQLTVSALYQLGITGEYEMRSDLGVIAVSHQRANPAEYCPAGPGSCTPIPVPDTASYQYTFVDSNTLRIDDPGCDAAGIAGLPCTVTYSRA